MSAALGLLLGAGILLVVSPLLWPRGVREATRFALMQRQRERLVQAGLSRISPATVFTVAGLLAVG